MRWRCDGAGSIDNVAISEIAPPFGCDSEPTTLPFDCEATLSLAPGESRVHRVTVVIPDDGRFDNGAAPTGETALP